MNNLDRMMEFVLASVFLFGGIYKMYRLVRLQRKANAIGVRRLPGPFGMPYGWVVAVGLFEIVAALALVIPFGHLPQTVVAQLAAISLAALMIVLSVYRMRHRQPIVLASTMFFLAMFVIIGGL